MKKITREEEEMDFKRMIIAMRGGTCSGKTICADAIAAHFGCSVIDYDDILDSLYRSPPASREEANSFTDVAFDVVCRLAQTQLELGRSVVVDSPFIRSIHRHRLFHLAEKFPHCSDSDCDDSHSRLIIVECKVDMRSQKRGFENRGCSDKWFKPKNWLSVRQSRSISDYFPRHLPHFVSALILDTGAPINPIDLTRAIDELCFSPDQGGRLVDFHRWVFNKSKEVNAVFSKEKASKTCDEESRHFFELVVTTDDDGGNNNMDSCCKTCQEPISSFAAYACVRCNLVLHKSCAESPRASNYSELLPMFRRDATEDQIIPEEYRQYRSPCCEQFSGECSLCLWEMHFRSRLVPTILRSDVETEDMSLSTFAIGPRKNIAVCEACMFPVSFACYIILLETKEYIVHVECALATSSITGVVGGEERVFDLMYGEREDGDYMCDHCLGERHPTAWFYHCHQSNISYHIHCVSVS